MTDNARLSAHPDVAAALGDGPALTDDQEHLLAVLLDPDNDEANHFSGATEDDIRADMLDQYAGFNTEGDWPWKAQRVADTFRAHLEREDTTAAGKSYGNTPFVFGYDSNAEGEIGMYQVGLYLGHDAATYLLDHHDPKYLWRATRDTSGLRAAVELAECIADDYARVLEKARRLGLLPAPPARPVWPQDEQEHLAYRDWQYEVANGDTAVAFRDWFEARGQ